MPAEPAVQELRAELATVISRVLGVARLEPTLRAALAEMARSARARIGPADRPSSTSPEAPVVGIEIGTRTDRSDGTVHTDVSVDLVTWSAWPAAQVASEVSRAIRHELRARGQRPGRVAVNVIEIAEHG